jgi:hypothetical protein
LRCEYLVDPLGIDTAQPRFSWKLIDADQTRGQKQAAWQLLVTCEDGQRVGTLVLAPAVSNLAKRTFYVTYDIAPHLKVGDNVIAVWTVPP